MNLRAAMNTLKDTEYFYLLSLIFSKVYGVLILRSHGAFQILASNG